MRALKVLVVVMGVLLVAGFAVLVATIMSRMSQRSAPAVAVATRPASFGTTTVTFPADSLVMETYGAGDRLVLRLELAGGGEMLVVLDAATGTELGRINLEREKAP
jgi:Family of unknown function (DUF6476)